MLLSIYIIGQAEGMFFGEKGWVRVYISNFQKIPVRLCEVQVGARVAYLPAFAPRMP